MFCCVWREGKKERQVFWRGGKGTFIMANALLFIWSDQRLQPPLPNLIFFFKACWRSACYLPCPWIKWYKPWDSYFLIQVSCGFREVRSQASPSRKHLVDCARKIWSEWPRLMLWFPGQSSTGWNRCLKHNDLLFILSVEHTKLWARGKNCHLCALLLEVSWYLLLETRCRTRWIS